MSDQITHYPAWHARAACAGADPNLFFPESMKDENALAAKRICRSCPVARECFESSLELDEPSGIWGGQGRKHRTQTLKKAREQVPDGA
jgi:WhiB family redox-sensing transcriptional regulator